MLELLFKLEAAPALLAYLIIVPSA